VAHFFLEEHLIIASKFKPSLMWLNWFSGMWVPEETKT